MEENLWNLSNGKTRKVIEYINTIHSPEVMYGFDHAKFERIKSESLTMSPNKALHHIGYRFGKSPRIFDDCGTRV